MQKFLTTAFIDDIKHLRATYMKISNFKAQANYYYYQNSGLFAVERKL